MKRGVVELDYLDSDIHSNPPKQRQTDAKGRAREEMRYYEAHALPRLATMSDVHSDQLTRGRHIRDVLRSPWRRRSGLIDLYRMHLAYLEASRAEIMEEQPQDSSLTALKAEMAIISVRARTH